MSMNKDRLGIAIVTALKTLNPDITGAAEIALLPYWKIISDEIIKEIIANMAITTTVNVPGITSGPSATTGTGTITSIS